MPTSETLDLTHLDEAGFDRLYKEQIEPWLVSHEDARRKGIASFQQGLVLSAAVGAGLAFVIYLFAKEWPPGLIFGFMATVLGSAFAYGPLSKLEEQVKGRLVDTLAKAVGVAFKTSGFDPPAFERLKALRLAPSYDRSSFEDLFHGQRQGCSFDLYEAHLESETRDKDGDRSYTTVFRGQIIRIAFPKDFAGVTIVRRDAGVFNALRSMGSQLQRVGLGDSRFERTFEVYSSDQVEARYLVHPVFMERLLELETAFKGKSIRCAFEKGDLLVAVEGGDKFEIGSMFQPMASPERVRKVVNDIAQVLKLMDAVLTAEQGPLIAQRFRAQDPKD
jgi:hypothetical protein